MRQFLGRPVPEDDPRFDAGRRRSHRADPVRVVVIGDSFTFTDASGPQLPVTPHLWPQVARRAVAAALSCDVDVAVLARPARTSRDAWDLVHKDRHAMFEVIAGADAVVVAFGSYDHAPMGVPAVVESVVPHLRPAVLRRRVRSGLRTAYPVVVRATGGRLNRTGQAPFRELYAAALEQVRGLAFGAAGVALGPSSHRTSYYGRGHRTHRSREDLQLRLAREQGFDAVPVWDLVEPHVDELNVDGIHWPAVVHEAVGHVVADRLVAQLDGRTDRPPRPALDEVLPEVAPASPSDRPRAGS